MTSPVGAEAALAAGDLGGAAQALDAALAAGEPVAAGLIARLCAGFIQTGRVDAAEAWARRGLETLGEDFDLQQALGVALRRQRRFDEAVEALTTAHTLRLGDPGPLYNLANVHNDRGDGVAAAEILDQLLAAYPDDAQLHHMMGRAQRHLGELEAADAALAEALRCDPRFIEAWRDRAMLASERQRHKEALAILDAAQGPLPDAPRLVERRAEVLIRAGRADEARACLEAALRTRSDAAWAHLQLARLLLDTDLASALAHAERGVAAAPNSALHRLALAHAQSRAAGVGRADLLQPAYEAARAMTARGGPAPVEHAFVLRGILAQAGDVDAAEAVGGFETLGRYWALNGQHAALLSQLPRVRTAQDRRELLHQHRMWAAPIERRAARNPVERRPRAPRDKLRIGFLSSDLRRHAVGHFAQALFEHYDRDRFDLYAYSFFPGEADAVQARIAGQIAGFRVMPGAAERDAAQAIAADGLDMLIELGATTRWNHVQVMAYRPARVQASWLGYPHSVGLADIDHLILDPHLRPSDPALLVERPLIMPSTWLALGAQAFTDHPPVGAPPQETNRLITFGTANNPNKYTRPMLQAWAQVVARTPDSRFLFVRPEAAAPAFRDNMRRAFAEAGVAEQRVLFQPSWGDHLQHYGRMDVSLDTFPLTGGTTTCEALWMGVPVISLRGEAVFERLSHSILTNAGLGELSSASVEGFVETAVALAADRARLTGLRATLRQRLRASPLGQSETFTHDFFDLVSRATST
ncbi:glycosyltransferase family 41 protein [Phenylobacterium sp.]|uniref:tetratricopeptide repeat protein n=1 Tax=Phenylobacterium sp. TaxID=1871053 RepID=UPI002737499F|nr:glycosyltransferase family 41 protein [Phenylobacterium sp.]MDP3659958.1 tetratricopeptide repeat protein [Phenylobacterium sp.]